MHSVVFLASHLFSGSTDLLYVLANDSRIQSYRTCWVYDHPDRLVALADMKHKCWHKGAIHLDEVLYNYNITSKAILDICRFLYVIREPRAVLNGIATTNTMSFASACRYYCYRLRRLCEMAKRTCGAVLLTYEDLKKGSGYELVREYLCLEKAPINEMGRFADGLEMVNLVPDKYLTVAEKAYNRYLYCFRELLSRRVR